MFRATKFPARQKGGSVGQQFLTLEELMAEFSRPPRLRERPRIFVARSKHRLRELRLSVVRGWQRWRRGYSEQDTWSFDGFLSPVILGGLEALRERDLGYPARYTPAEWSERLDTMIAGFRIAAETDAWDLTDEDLETFRQAGEMFIEDYFDLWD